MATAAPADPAAGVGVFGTVREAYRSKTFGDQLFFTCLINFIINGGIEWAVMSGWGARPNKDTWPDMWVWKVNHENNLNSSLGQDMFITCFAMAFFCSLLATGGTQKEVREKKCLPLAPSATAGGVWRFTPVRIRNLCMRSLALGLYIMVLVGVPSVLLVWAIFGSTGTLSGFGYVLLKAFWAGTVVAVPVYTLVFPSAIDKRNFPDMGYEKLMDVGAGGGLGGAGGRDDGPPMVANIAHI